MGDRLSLTCAVLLSLFSPGSIGSSVLSRPSNERKRMYLLLFRFHRTHALFLLCMGLVLLMGTGILLTILRSPLSLPPALLADQVNRSVKTVASGSTFHGCPAQGKGVIPNSTCSKIGLTAPLGRPFPLINLPASPIQHRSSISR
jgi:hypothetical protein